MGRRYVCASGVRVCWTASSRAYLRLACFLYRTLCLYVGRLCHALFLCAQLNPCLNTPKLALSPVPACSSSPASLVYALLHQVHEELHSSGGDGAEAQARRILFGLGFDDTMQVRHGMHVWKSF